MSDLVNRERVNFTVNKELMVRLRSRSQSSGVPMSKMIDKAITKTYFERGGEMKKYVTDLYKQVDELSVNEIEGGQRVLDAALKIWEERKSDTESDYVVDALLSNKLTFDGINYIDYLDNAKDIDYMEEAQILKEAYDMIATAKEIENML